MQLQGLVITATITNGSQNHTPQRVYHQDQKLYYAFAEKKPTETSCIRYNLE